MVILIIFLFCILMMVMKHKRPLHLIVPEEGNESRNNRLGDDQVYMEELYHIAGSEGVEQDTHTPHNEIPPGNTALLLSLLLEHPTVVDDAIGYSARKCA